MSIRSEVLPFLVSAVVIDILVMLMCRALGVARPRTVVAGTVLTLVLTGYLLYFFRDPERIPPEDNSLIVAGADGIVMRIKELGEEEFPSMGSFGKAGTVRISIFLTLLDVHVNRAPISGKAKFLGYYPGKHLFTFQEKSSDINQHNSILIKGEKTQCLINQIVGPVCRRVVYWPDHEKEVDVKMGDRIGMMKFGSRLDMYFPKDDVTVVVNENDKVRAGETVVAKLR